MYYPVINKGKSIEKGLYFYCSISLYEIRKFNSKKSFTVSSLKVSTASLSNSSLKKKHLIPLFRSNN